MFSKTLSVFLVVYLFSDLSHGQSNQTYFLTDYNYIEAIGRYYKYHTTPKNWQDAKNVCAQEGASLFYPENRDEFNAVASFWKLYYNDTGADHTWVYVGISDIATEGVFETIDGKSISEVFNQWKTGTPDNFGDEDCVHINQLGNYNDITCDSEYSFICKKKSLDPIYSGAKQQSNTDGQSNQTYFLTDYNYIEAIGRYYKYHTTPKNWQDAKNVCAQEGASLFYPENSDEFNAVASFWKLYYNDTGADHTWVYVGISDIATEGVFETIDGKSISEVFNQWKTGNPDNFGDEDCVHINQLGNYNDITCDSEYSFICKKKSLDPIYSGAKQQSNTDGQSNQTYFLTDYNYIEAIGRYYKYHTTPKNWQDAKNVCAQEGASLFYPENRDEFNAVASFWKLYYNDTGADHTWVYVGISDIATEGVFETIDGKSISEVFNQWKTGTPDNFGDEDCVHINQLGNYNDITCDSEYSFICKKKSLDPIYSGAKQQSNTDGQSNQTYFLTDYNYIEAIGRYYKYHTTPKNWQDAKNVCAQEGASLFYPENRDEFNAVASFWKLYYNDTGADHTWVYVGISDIATEGVFETIDGKSISEVFNQWKTGTPDNFGDEDCVHINQLGNYNDITCDSEYSFICKKKSLDPIYSGAKQQSNTDGQSNQTYFLTDYNYIEAIGRYYKYHTTPKNWQDAKNVCAQEGASLFYPENRDEFNAVASFWKLYYNDTGADHTWVYVGISDIATEGVFETIDGKSISEVFNQWKTGTPDNFGDEDCVHINQLGNYNDITCDSEYSFICKKKSLDPIYSGAKQQSNTDGQSNQTYFLTDYNYIEAIGRYYKYHTTPKNWQDAKNVCAQEGASLFYPENRDEFNAVASFWKLYYNDTGADHTWVYVGISDIATEGVFETIDGKSISEVFNQWKTGTPDNFGDEDCVHINQLGNYNDITCDSEYSFICKKKSLDPIYSGAKQQSNTDGQSNQKYFLTDYNYIEAIGRYYKYHTTPKNWQDAKNVCAQEGASLFYPENSDEFNAVASFWKLYYNDTGADHTWVYVGISDIATEGVFETIDGKSISEVFNQWKNGTPDSFGDEDCVHINQLGNYNDITCDSEYSFICKKKSLDPIYSGAKQQSNTDEQSHKTYFLKDYNCIQALGSYYKYHSTPKNWRDANNVCAQEGASLFYPENGDEFNAVASFWKLYYNGTGADKTWVYVGISDIATEGVFETIDGKSISEVLNQWKIGNPDNFGDEDCVHINQLGNYNDIKCDSEYSFICKRSSLDPNYSCAKEQSNSNGQRDKKIFRQDYTYIEASSGFYKMHTIPKNFADAKQTCAQEGASLFFPENNKPVSDGYNNWQSGEPNDSLGTEDCGWLTKQTGADNDGPCNIKYPFICKKSLQSLEWDDNCNMPNLDYTFNKDIRKCYKFHTTPLTWTEAYAVCSAEQSYLAVITNATEADYLAKLTESAPEQKAKGDYLRGIYHVGFHNRFNKGWQTVKGTPFNDAEAWWGNYQPEADNRKQCGAMFFNGLLTQINCDMRSFFICEHEGVSASSDNEENYMVLV